MASIFDPTDPIMPFRAPQTEYQVNIDPASDLGEMSDFEPTVEASERNFWPYIGVIALTFIVFAVRLLNLQVTQSATFRVLAQGNRVESRYSQPPRGVIVDQKGQDLVKNIPLYSLDLLPAQLPKVKADREAIYQRVSDLTGVSKDEIVKQIDKYGLTYNKDITLKDNLDRDTALDWQVKLGDLTGIAVNLTPNRSYDLTKGMAHLLGYVGKVAAEDLKTRPELQRQSTIGKAGLELFYDKFLQGTVGRDQVEVNAAGKIQRVVANEPAVPGNTLKLYLNKDFQQVMGDALKEGAEKAGSKKGVAIAMDVNSGGILGMVSLPDYDNNVFSQTDKSNERQKFLSDKDQPLFNRAIAGMYPPGSTSKPIWAAVGLQEGIITELTDIQTPAEIKIGQSTFPDWKYHGHADVKKAIAESNNIFFYAVAGGYDKIKGLGPQKMKEYATRFHWGLQTGIDLPGESKGFMPDPDWKKQKLKEPWYIGDTYHQGIGQGYMTLTPLQIVNAVAAIANGGTLYEPRLVKEIVDQDGKAVEVPGKKVAQEHIINADALRIVREGMRQTVTAGSASPLNTLSMQVAGKTGTAQFEEKDKTHAWFVGFAPYDKPKIAILVMVEGGGESFDVAVPIAKNILGWYSEHSQDVQVTE